MEKIIAKKIIGNTRRLHKKLGKWDKKAEEKWKWWYSYEEQRLYKKKGPFWRSYRRLSQRQQRIMSARFQEINIVEEIPKDTVMVTTYNVQQWIKISSCYNDSMIQEQEQGKKTHMRNSLNNATQKTSGQ